MTDRARQDLREYVRDEGGRFAETDAAAYTTAKTASPQFKAWFEDSKVVDDDGAPLVVYHGTTHDIDEFKAAGSAGLNPESDWGAGVYFTSDPEDASTNYAGEGPDLTNRIESRADELMSAEETVTHEEALEVARAELAGRSPSVIPAYLKMEKPLVMGTPNGSSSADETHFDMEYEYDDPDDPDSDIVGVKGSLPALITALREEGAKYDVETRTRDKGYASMAVDALEEHLSGDDYVSASRLVKIWKKIDVEIAHPETGQLMRSEMLRGALERAGYDGVIDRTVDDKFGTGRTHGQAMKGLTPDTTHFIVFQPTQIKSAIGNTTFDPATPKLTLAYREKLWLLWDAEEHPRDEDGKFASGGGSGAKDIPAGAKGECFRNTLHWVRDHDAFDVVHGKVTNGDGRTFDHAWAESAAEVADPTTGVQMDKARWYGLVKAQPEAKYTAEQAMVNAVRTRTLGPWTADEVGHRKLDLSDWDEGQHPRDASGKFAESDDDDAAPTITGREVQTTLAPTLAKAAQQVYDDWDEDPDCYAGGGICHLIAEEIAGKLSESGIEAATVSAQVGEQHVWVVAKLKDGVYAIDIPPSTYETGGGYTWQKIKGVAITPQDIAVDRIDADPAKFEDYLDMADVLVERHDLDWDEADHPRDDAGRFAASPGGRLAEASLRSGKSGMHHATFKSVTQKNAAVQDIRSALEAEGFVAERIEVKPEMVLRPFFDPVMHRAALISESSKAAPDGRYRVAVSAWLTTRPHAIAATSDWAALWRLRRALADGDLRTLADQFVYEHADPDDPTSAIVGVQGIDLADVWDEAAHPRNERGQFVGGASSVTVGGRTVQVTHSRRAARAGDVLVPIDLATFDQAWRREGDFYLDPFGSNRISNRYERVGEFLKTATQLDAAEVHVSDDGRVGFSDGRHRTAYLRDAGVTQVPVSMTKASLKNAKKFGFVAPGPTHLSAHYALWDEVLHPRDEAGKFTESGGTARTFEGNEGYEWAESTPLVDYAVGLPPADKDAIDSYAGFGYADMNNHLRGTFTPRIVDEKVRDATPEEIAAFKFPGMGHGHHASDYKEDDPLNKVADGRIAHNFYYKGGYKQDDPAANEKNRVDTYTIERAGPDVKYVKELERKNAQINESIRERGYVLPEAISVNRAAYIPGLSHDDIVAMEGKVIEEKGFTSTMVGNPSGRFDGYVQMGRSESIYKRTGGKTVDNGEVGTAMRIQIVLPEGTKVAAVEPVRRIEYEYPRVVKPLPPELQEDEYFKAHPEAYTERDYTAAPKIKTDQLKEKSSRSEAEVLLGSGAQFKVVSVRQGKRIPASPDGSVKPLPVTDVVLEYIGGGSSEGAGQKDLADREYVRDDAGRFAETGGAGKGPDAPASGEAPVVDIRSGDSPIDEKRRAFLDLAESGDAADARLDAMRVELQAAWKTWSDDTRNRPRPLKIDGAAAKKLDSYKAAKALEAEFHRQHDDAMDATRTREYAAREMLKVPEGERSTVTFERDTRSPLHPALADSADRALATLRQFDGSGAFESLRFPADKVAMFREAFGDATPLVENDDGSFSIPARITLAKADGDRPSATMTAVHLAGGRNLESAVYHEVAHHIEMKNGAIRRAAIELREKLADQPRVAYKLNSVSPSLGDAEVALKGNFPDPYSAKLYPQDIATEMISTGVQSYMADPIRFARERPEHFKLTFDVLHGKYRGK